jgi:NADH-quinone oxidoreductase subunit F
MDFDSDAVITIGTRVSVDNLSVKTYIDRTLLRNEADFIYMHPIDDISLQNKYSQYIKYEAGSEEGVFALLASYLIVHSTPEYKKYFKNLDIGYLSGETSVGEEEFEQLLETLEDKKNITLIIGEDIYEHPNKKNIINLIRLMDMYADINVVLLGTSSKIDLARSIQLADISTINTYNGTVIYTVNVSSKIPEENVLKGSSSFATAAKIEDGDTVEVIYESTTERKKFVIDPTIRGTIALFPVVNGEKTNKIVSGYRFKRVQIQKVKL